MNETEWRNKIDDYHTSIQAIVGFANFFVWDAKKKAIRDGVTVFQGRKLSRKPEVIPPSDEKGGEILDDDEKATESQVVELPVAPSPEGSDKSTEHSASVTEIGEKQGEVVTPDLGIVTVDGNGVLAEVKISFPRDESHWFDDFDQLMRYDADFDGWPTENGTVSTHDVVLIVEQGRANKIRKFFEKHQGTKINFARPFVIVQCNRSDNREPYYFFATISGQLTAPEINELLDDGTKVPMKVLVEKYSTVKIYDAEPPLPYMMDLIWSHVVLEDARQDSKFRKLRKRQKLPVVISIEDIVLTLREGFTFRSLEMNASDGSPAMPHPQWVRRAIEQMVVSRDAEWIDATKASVRFFFQTYEDPLDHFIQCCVAGQAAANAEKKSPVQLRLFDVS